MNKKRKRGRAPKVETIANRDFENALSKLPASRKMSDNEQAQLEDWLNDLERARQETLKTNKYGRTTPDTHAYEMESIDDESMNGHRTQLLARDKAYKEMSETFQRKAVRATEQNAQDRAKSVCQNFRSLLSRVEPLGPTTLTQASELMRQLWAQHGNLGDPPTTRTLRSYIRQASPFPVHRLGKTASKKK